MDMEDVDRISLLPDCLVHEILSFLNARSVVQTCVLSKRWKTLWTDIPTLNFDFESTGIVAPNSKRTSARRFICRFLSEHRPKTIKKLSFSSSIRTREAGLIVDFLVCYARHHTVQELCLNTYNSVYEDWPLGLLECSTLTVLKMKRTFADEWDVEYPPSLRILEIEYVWGTMLSLSEPEDVFSKCPNLESLVLVNYPFEDLCVSAPKLENFQLSTRWKLSFPQVKLLTPNLKIVKLGNMLPTVKTASEFSCIYHVDILLRESSFGGDSSAMQKLKLSISDLLRVFHNATSFTLPPKAMEVLLSVPSSLSGVSFRNLIYLEFKTKATNQTKSLPISTLMNSLNCPNLEMLEVELELEPNQE